MKTSELLRRIKETGYEYNSMECYIKIYISKKDLECDEPYLTIVKNQSIEGIKVRNGMSISSNQSRSLIRLALDYLDTPSNDREEEKRYILKSPLKNWIGQRLYLNNNDNCNCYLSFEYKREYTQKEIDAMPFDTNFFIKEEVK